MTQYLESDLRDVINGPEILNDDHVRYIMVQVLRALDYIHSAGVIHRDLTPSNIAITSDMEVRQWIYFFTFLMDCLYFVRFLKPEKDSRFWSPFPKYQ